MFQKVLVAVDGSDRAMRALEVAARLAKAESARLVVATVAYVPPLYRVDLNPELSESFRASARLILDDARKAATRLGTEAEMKLVEDAAPAEGIARLAVDGGFDLIVLGRRGLNPAEDRTLGGVSDAVLHRTRCSVMLVH